MGRSCPDWSNLPVEISLDIFQQSIDRDRAVKRCNMIVSNDMFRASLMSEPPNLLRKYARVCKNWTYSAQSLLYSHVCIHKLSQLRKFFNTVESNASLGKMVKVFCVHNLSLEEKMDEEATKEMNNIVTNLLSKHLVNLEEIKGYGGNSYLPIINALPNLKRLRKITKPIIKTRENERDNYIKCAFMLKDRLENLTILNTIHELEDDLEEEAAVNPFNRLYDELQQFDKLTEIHVERETREDIKAFEYVAENCKLLKKIGIRFDPPFDEDALLDNNHNLLHNNSFSIDAILKLNPMPNVKFLNGELYLSKDCKNLVYIMHKFPQLGEIDLSMMDDSPETLNQHILNQLLYYLHRMDSYSVTRLVVEPVIITEVIASYWNTNSTFGSEYIKIEYSKWDEEDQNQLDLVKSRILDDTYIGLRYLTVEGQDNELVHKTFLEKNGKYIHKLQFTLDTRCFHNSPIDFLTHALSFCPNLEYLNLNECVLKQSSQLPSESSTGYSLTRLYLGDCKLYPNMLKQISLLVPKVDQLRLGEVKCYDDNTAATDADSESEDDSDDDDISRTSKIQIIMPHTKIDDIAFERSFYCRPLYVKIYVPDNGNQYHYQLESLVADKDFSTLSAEEYYIGVKQGVKEVHIHCANLPHLRADLF